MSTRAARSSPERGRSLARSAYPIQKLSGLPNAIFAGHALRPGTGRAPETPSSSSSIRDGNSRTRTTTRTILRFVASLWLTIQLHAADNAPALTPVADAKPILSDLQQKMSSLTSVYLEFTQERHLQLFAEPLQSEGVMLIDRPGLIRWETTTPYQSILLGNQKFVAQFEATDGKWNKLKVGFPQMLKRVMDQMTLMHQGKIDALTSDFTVSVSTGAVTVVTMVPKDADVRAMLAALEIHLHSDLSATREVVMREPGGDFTRIIFNRERRDVKFPERTFDQFKPAELTAIKAAVSDAK